MKKIIFTLLIIHCSLIIANAQWVQCNGINGGIIEALSVSGNNILAGTFGYGVYFSTNNGTSWSRTSILIQNVYCFTVNGNYTFSGSCNNFNNQLNGVYTSGNNGVNWSLTPSGLQYMPVYSLAASGNYIFAGSFYNGLYISSNYGTTWILSSLTQIVYAMTVSGNNFFIGTHYNGVYISTNNGTSWTQTTLINQRVNSFASNGNNIYAGTDSNGVYNSTDNGSSWMHSFLNNQCVYSLATFGSNIIAGTYNNGVFLSTNNGTNWIQFNQGFSVIPTIYSLLITSEYIFAGTNGQSVWRRPVSDIVDIKNISAELSSSYSLSQNYPNPFNPTTTIKYALPKNEFVTIKVYDITGREMKLLVNEYKPAGFYTVNFNGSNLASGVYFYRIQAGDFVSVKRMLMIK